jgi:hypothetical protein
MKTNTEENGDRIGSKYTLNARTPEEYQITGTSLNCSHSISDSLQLPFSDASLNSGL